jgi:hypothetical protein
MQCKCGSFAINDDPEQVLCDRCWRDAKIASLEDDVARLQKELDEIKAKQPALEFAASWANYD